MKRAAWAASLFVVLAACTDPGDDRWVLESAHCHSANGACRVLWTGYPTRLLVLEIMSAGTSGSFQMPALGWQRITMTEDPDETLGITLTDAGAPISTKERNDQILFARPPVSYFDHGSAHVDSFALDDRDVSVKLTISGELYFHGQPGGESTAPFTQSFELSAKGPSSDATADDVVAAPP